MIRCKPLWKTRGVSSVFDTAQKGPYPPAPGPSDFGVDVMLALNAKAQADMRELRAANAASAAPQAAADPWKHRSQGMQCATCMWFVAKDAGRRLGDRVLGRCRRHAPTLNGYPAVFQNDWCGDHKLDETKI
jgi:hypothetical protein